MADPLDILANTADGVVAVDAQGRIVLWNEAAEKILGHATREVLGKPCCEVLKGLDSSGNRFCSPGCNVLTMVKTLHPGEQNRLPEESSPLRTSQHGFPKTSRVACPRIFSAASFQSTIRP